MRITAFSLLMTLLPLQVAAFEKAALDEFATEVAARHSLEESWIQEILSSAEKKQSILDAISRPAEKTRPWHEYRSLFINERRIRDGAVFWQQHQETLDRVADECGVPAEIIVAILGIETHYGSRAGSYRVIDALSTLAFEYPPRSEFFRSELEQFLLLSREHEIDPYEALGSYAGAMGAAQFISSSYRRYAVDGSGDGRIDLWKDWRDVIGSVAYYLHSFGWQRDKPVVETINVDADTATSFIGEKLALDTKAGQLRASNLEIDSTVDDDQPVLVFELENINGPEFWVGHNNFYVITRYNHSRMYAMAVIDLGAAIAQRVKQQ